ncbi:MAG: hypothetical protein HQK72_07085 [Desulfamplus sp.]|nr:hypothetical protein [Desulfamplus sp.]
MLLLMSKIKVRFIYIFALFFYAALSSLFYPFMGRCSSDTLTTLVINSDMQYRYALELFEKQDFQSAIVEFNRFIYFFPNDNRIKDATFKKGVSLFHAKRYGDAINLFRELSLPLFDTSTNTNATKHDSEHHNFAVGNAKNDDAAKDNFIDTNFSKNDSDNSVNIEALFMLSTTFLAIKRDASAEMVLQDFLLLNNEIDEPEIEDKALYALAWIYIGKVEKVQSSYKEALDALLKAVRYIDRMTPNGKEKYKADNLKVNLLKTVEITETEKKNPLIAGIASIIPGGGFAYANRYHDAIVAFLLNSAFILAAIESFEDGNSALGGLIGFVGFGFYGGSIYGGISSVHKNNKEIIKTRVDRIRQNIEAKQSQSQYSIYPNPLDSESDSYFYDKKNKSSGHKIPLLSIKIPF